MFFYERQCIIVAVEKQVLFCVVRRSEVWGVRQIVRNTDPKAFVIVSDAGQVLGKGFSTLDSNEN